MGQEEKIAPHNPPTVARICPHVLPVCKHKLCVLGRRSVGPWIHGDVMRRGGGVDGRSDANKLIMRE